MGYKQNLIWIINVLDIVIEKWENERYIDINQLMSLKFLYADLKNYEYETMGVIIDYMQEDIFDDTSLNTLRHVKSDSIDKLNSEN